MRGNVDPQCAARTRDPPDRCYGYIYVFLSSCTVKPLQCLLELSSVRAALCNS
jgi:hypothetical protein